MQPLYNWHTRWSKSHRKSTSVGGYRCIWKAPTSPCSRGTCRCCSTCCWTLCTARAPGPSWPLCVGRWSTTARPTCATCTFSTTRSGWVRCHPADRHPYLPTYPPLYPNPSCVECPPFSPCTLYSFPLRTRTYIPCTSPPPPKTTRTCMGACPPIPVQRHLCCRTTDFPITTTPAAAVTAHPTLPTSSAQPTGASRGYRHLRPLPGRFGLRSRNRASAQTLNTQAKVHASRARTLRVDAAAHPVHGH